MRRFLYSLFATLSMFSGVFALMAPASAAVDTGLQAVGNTIKLGSTDPKEIIVRVINIALGFIGVILVVLVLYAGFLWMTSGGDTKKVDQAKKMITNAVIGLVIVLSAWAITKFIIQKLVDATSGDGGGTVTFDTGTGGGGLGGGRGRGFTITGITPKGQLRIANVEVKIAFTRPIDGTSASAFAVTQDGGVTVGGAWTIQGSEAKFVPSDVCPQNPSKHCFAPNTSYTVRVDASGIRSVTGERLSCGLSTSNCMGQFTTGDQVDANPPDVSIVFPTEGFSVPAGLMQDVHIQASDDTGIATVQGYDNGAEFDVPESPKDVPSPLSFLSIRSWDTGASQNGSHALTALAEDIDTNSRMSNAVNVMVRPAYCFAQPEQPGTSCNDAQGLCGACSGGSCTQNSQCQSGFCVSGTCQQRPVISAMSPDNGRPGTFVTIQGANFGSQPGTVTFTGGAVASAPASCGSAMWSPTQVVVEVPANAQNGPIQIRNSESGLTDTTDDDVGVRTSFIVNDVAHPGLCAIDPTKGSAGTQTTLNGYGFGATPQQVYFGDSSYTPSSGTWFDTHVALTVPVVDLGYYPIYVHTNGGDSNPVQFYVQERSAGQNPTIALVEPPKGAPGTYVTITGSGFGSLPGSVQFIDGAGNIADGSADFPPACSQGYWTDNRVVIKAPDAMRGGAEMPDGGYQIKVIRVSDGKASNVQPFTVDRTVPFVPGICAVDPMSGPIGTMVKITGTRFQPESVVSFNGTNASVDASQSSESTITATVPNGATTGNLVVSQGSFQSNGVPFAVQNCNDGPNVCADGFQCCANGACIPMGGSCPSSSRRAEFAWKISTGKIPVEPRVIEECRPDVTPMPAPSPSPWLGRTGGDQVPVDASIQMRFTTLLDPSTVNPTTIKIWKCDGTGAKVCDQATEVTSRDGIVLGVWNNTQQMVTLDPDLQPSSHYLVTVSTNVQSSADMGSAPMMRKDSCGSTPDGKTKELGYCFEFVTRADAGKSKIGHVLVAPGNVTVTDTDTRVDYAAEPLLDGDACIVLNCRTFDWKWYTGDSLDALDGRGFITSDLDVKTGLGGCVQQGSGKAETGDVPVLVHAFAQSATDKVGEGKMYVKFQPPHVVDYSPNCSEACNNALIDVKWSEALDPNSIDGNVSVLKCANENCYQTTGELDVVATLNPSNPKELMVQPSSATQNLDAGVFYKVILKGGPGVAHGILGNNGVPMSGLNDQSGFSWIFRVRVDGAECVASKVNVVPGKKIETRVDTFQAFTATPVTDPDKCSSNGELLRATDSSWVSTKPTVADFMMRADALLRTNVTALPLGCTSNCLASGSKAMVGTSAVCGNGVIETTDAMYCRSGKTPSGKPCTVFPRTVNAGEECEPSLDGAMCNPKTCLFNPVEDVPPAGNGTCGNGKVDVGEACDFGPTCVGGSQPASNVQGVPENTPCLTEEMKTACAAAGGTCAMHDYRGCSANCRHLGATAGHSTCGNSDLGDGKDCDDGNTRNGDGCSSQCLHEGAPLASTSAGAASVCGNGVLEPGELCEALTANGKPIMGANGQPMFPAGCNPKTCLHTGTTPCVKSSSVSCCGNGKIEAGEDCDGTPGCSASCLMEGASLGYKDANGNPAISYCGDGYVDAGEQCDVGVSTKDFASAVGYGTPKAEIPGDPIVGSAPATSFQESNMQIARMYGNDTPDANGLMSTDLNVTMYGKTGTAMYGLQCGYTSEASCPEGFGLDTFGCCSERPKMSAYAPSSDHACRNALIRVSFAQQMSSPSVVNNVEIAKLFSGDTCPKGLQLAGISQEPPTGFFRRVAWNIRRVLTSWFGAPAMASDVWCKGDVTGQLVPAGGATSTDMFTFKLDHALEANTSYRVRFLGDPNLDDNDNVANRVGIKTSRGVVFGETAGPYSPDVSWTFKTGPELCAVNNVVIEDTTQTSPGQKAHPFQFQNPRSSPETRSFMATAESVRDGVSEAITPVAEYSWTWTPWAVENTKIAEVAAPTADFHDDTAQITSKLANGISLMTVQLNITNDAQHPLAPNAKYPHVEGNHVFSVLACENPWPSVAWTPFADDASQVDQLKATVVGADTVDPKEFANFYNIATMYCRDVKGSAGAEAGTPSVVGTYPAMDIHILPTTKIVNGDSQPNVDRLNGVLRQFLFTFPADSGLSKDAIGLRVMRNDSHLSPMEWYRSRGFSGQPTPTTVGGYPAITDGATTYIAGSNRPMPSQGNIYSNIVILSHNPDAATTTIAIYDQMLQYLTMNVNILGQSNTCVNPDGSFYQKDGQIFSCSADYECVRLDPTLSCASMKDKLTRDTQRIADFWTIGRQLEQQRGMSSYPMLSTGTFLRGTSVSTWPSWTQTLSGGKTLPVDPINRMLTCGRCKNDTTKNCQSDAECGSGNTCGGGSLITNADGSTQWSWNDKVDPQTCWNEDQRTYFCPSIGTTGAGVSRLYQYTVLNNGNQYRLGSEFELPPVGDGTTDWWSPVLPKTVYRCSNAEMKDVVCNANGNVNTPNDALCRACNTDHSCFSCVGGANNGKTCTSSTDCPSGTCVDTAPVPKGSCVQSGGTYAYTGVCSSSPSKDNGVCGDGVLNPGELCDSSSPSTWYTCSLPNGAVGKQKVICNTSGPNACKEYRPDPSQPQCVPAVKCGDGRVDAPEVCDDGALNGKYGHCNATCSGYDKYCGNATVEPGELCDNGTDISRARYNGQWSAKLDPASCSIDCRSVGPYCGDGVVSNGEACDGAPETTTSAICSGGTVLCTTNADCPSGESCGVDTKKSCVGVTVTDADGVVRQTEHVRQCNAPGTANACQFDAWSPCEPIGKCGNGVVDPGEQCDDGKNDGSGSCAKGCKLNVCGDGQVYAGVEECDMGSQNGKTTCSADYGSSCLSCSTSCKWMASSGGYCGNGVKDGGEQCDGTAGLSGVTCQSLGYDYAKSSTPTAPTGTGVLNFQLAPISSGLINAISPTTPTTPTDTGSPTCSSSCQFQGCVRCGDTPGNGVITARVYDALFQQVVVGARVSLLSHGVTVDETTTDENGVFSFKTLDQNPACNTYRVIVDMYGDNPCTGPRKSTTPACYSSQLSPWVYPYDVNEASQGGYFSFTSDPFASASFASVTNGVDTDGTPHVDLYPRPAIGNVYMAISWKPTSKITENFLHISHAIVPPEYATVLSSDYSTGRGVRCLYDGRLVSGLDCIRDVNGLFRGPWDIDSAPYIHQICLHRAGERTSNSLDQTRNNCPVEGTKLCLQNHPGDTKFCGAAGAQTCGVDGKTLCNCAADPNWEDCSRTHFSPVTTLVNAQAFNGSTEPIHLHYSAWAADDVTKFMTKLRDARLGFKAILATNTGIKVVTPPTTGSGRSWFVADIDPKTQDFVVQNTVVGTDPTPSKPLTITDNGASATGMACSNYITQCGPRNVCFQKTSPFNLPWSGDLKTMKVIGACFAASDQADCAKNGGTCGDLTEGAYRSLNY